MHALQGLTDRVHSDSSRHRKPVTALPHYDSSCMKEGYLQKKGQRLKGWKRRWFVCDGRALSYYISRKDRKPNAVIPLESCSVQDGGVSETWNSPRIYLTDGTCGVMYCLSGEDAAVVTAWLNVLRTAVTKVLAGDLQHQTSGYESAERMESVEPVDKPLVKRLVSDDEEPQSYKAPPSNGARTMALASADSIVPEKRTTRLVSAPAQVKAQRTKAEHHPTNITLENELASGLDLLEVLLTNRNVGRGGVVFRPIGATNGVLKSVGADPSGVKFYARASTILPVPSDVASFYITDHAKRAEWDIHFPHSMHVASFDEATDLIHISGGFQQIESTKPFVTPQLAAAAGSLLGALLASSWDSMLVSAVIAGIVGAVLNSIEYSVLCAPRDLVLVRHVRESSMMDKRVASSSDIMEDGEDTPPVVMILEKSVVSELKPTLDGAVRAHVGLSGWLLEPVEGDRTRATYVSDLDAKGWVSPATKKDFLLQRLGCVSVLLEHVTQSQLSGTDPLMDDDRMSVDGDVKDDDLRRAVAYVDDRSDVVATSREFHPSVYMKGMMQIPSGGLKLVDKEVAKKQGGVLKDVIKSAGAKILEGKGTVSLSLPVRIFEPRTNLERVVDLFLYAPTFLNMAADQTDPVERFKLVMAFAVAGMHHSVGQLKPFNPILGETYQSVLNDGTDVCCEHTSHHPPVSNFQLVGKKYSISGHVLWHGSFSMKSNAVVQNNRGPIHVKFEDGTTISFHLPVMQSGGFLWGDRTVELLGNVLFEDKKNRLVCDLKFNPDEKKGMGGMFSASKTPSDQFRGAIVNAVTGSELCDVSGSWLEELRFGEKAYWRYGRERSGYTLPMPESQVLVSDSRNREDLRYLAMNDLDTAQDWKVRLEVLQRADRKIRNEGRRPNHWALRDEKGH
ncbi:hypothetical protein Poli38472_014131 [Pythium oligandrum]|uniref:PH domain-containing protein n=1 Tax=Pythium oligandrum TaxID=41045 RepID=A0A8K1CI55_PYTOL|nr:hypothetical protein Poli38472_014131 [Pythium oligandrum]|eukprot:TMW64014.1 hypothetical protein Poli38472_014131 [Pythium oligandrum]